MKTKQTTNSIDSVEALFGAFGTIPQLADAIGENHWTVAKWKQRGRIPQTAWASVVSAARRKGKDLSAEDLMVMHSPARTKIASSHSASR